MPRERGGTGSKAGTPAKPSLIRLVGVSVPRPNGSRAGRARHVAEEKRKFSPYSERGVSSCCQYHDVEMLILLRLKAENMLFEFCDYTDSYCYWEPL